MELTNFELLWIKDLVVETREAMEEYFDRYQGDKEAFENILKFVDSNIHEHNIEGECAMCERSIELCNCKNTILEQ